MKEDSNYIMRYLSYIMGGDKSFDHSKYDTTLKCSLLFEMLKNFI